jgi:hypothetical protein
VARSPDRAGPGATYTLHRARSNCSARASSAAVAITSRLAVPQGIRRRLCATKAEGAISGASPTRVRDEGRPLGIGLQDQVPNHLKLQRSRVFVVMRWVVISGNTASLLLASFLRKMSLFREKSRLK